jgi:hypothetical protein
MPFSSQSGASSTKDRVTALLYLHNVANTISHLTWHWETKCFNLDDLAFLAALFVRPCFLHHCLINIKNKRSTLKYSNRLETWNTLAGCPSEPSKQRFWDAVDAIALVLAFAFVVLAQRMRSDNLEMQWVAFVSTLHSPS